jgi:hypothetical protein
MAMKPLALGEVQLPPQFQYNHLLLNVIQETINSAFTQDIPGIIENIFQRCEHSTKEGNKIKYNLLSYECFFVISYSVGLLFWIGIFIQNQVHGRIDGVEVTRESLQKTEERLNKRVDTLEAQLSTSQVNQQRFEIQLQEMQVCVTSDFILF